MEARIVPIRTAYPVDLKPFLFEIREDPAVRRWVYSLRAAHEIGRKEVKCLRTLEEMLWKNDVNLKDNGEDGSQRITYNCMVICCGPVLFVSCNGTPSTAGINGCR